MSGAPVRPGAPLQPGDLIIRQDRETGRYTCVIAATCNAIPSDVVGEGGSPIAAMRSHARRLNRKVDELFREERRIRRLTADRWACQ